MRYDAFYARSRVARADPKLWDVITLGTLAPSMSSQRYIVVQSYFAQSFKVLHKTYRVSSDHLIIQHLPRVGT